MLSALKHLILCPSELMESDPDFLGRELAAARSGAGFSASEGSAGIYLLLN